jgi:hypothetical protein
MTKSGKPSGKPNGRPPSPVQGREQVTTSMTLAIDVVEKIDRLRKGNETRRNLIERLVREVPEREAWTC